MARLVLLLFAAVIASLAGALASCFHRRSRERDTTHAA